MIFVDFLDIFFLTGFGGGVYVVDFFDASFSRRLHGLCVKNLFAKNEPLYACKSSMAVGLQTFVS